MAIGVLGVLGLAVLASRGCATSFNAPILPALLGYSVGAPADDVLQERLVLAEGYALGRFAEGLERVRFLRLTPRGDLLASLPRDGSVVLLERDADGDGRADGQRVLLEGLDRPHGMDLRDGWLYVAETDAIGRVRFDPQARSVSGSFERIVTGLPGGGNHWTRTLRTAGCTSRSARAATCARRRIRAGRRWCATGPTAAASRSSRAGCATALGSTGGQGPASSTPPTTGATCWVTISRPAS
jgi:hypothetical protein